MSKFKVDILRRIENLATTIGLIPKVGKQNENHIDDNWDDDKIYKGELFLNLKDNKIFTSNGKEILHLNTPKNYILNGLRVLKPTTAGEGIALDLRITTGYCIINGKLCKHTSEFDENPDVSDYQINLAGTSQAESKIVFLFAKQVPLASTAVQQNNYLDIQFEQKIITGTNEISNFQELNLKDLEGDILNNLIYKTPNELGLTNYMTDEYLLLAVIFVPANYNVSSFNKLEPISLSNNCSSYPIQEKSYKDLVCERIFKIDVWDIEKVFYKTQIIRNENNLYIVHKTFGNGLEFDINKYILPDFLPDDEIITPSECECECESESECECESEFVSLNYLSKIGLDYTDPTLRLPGKSFWTKAIIGVQKSTDLNYYKYIVGTVPNLDPVNFSDIKTIDLPEVTINGVRATVAFNNSNKDDAHIYFAKESDYQDFDPNNYTPAELESLLFSGRQISEGYYIIWNKEKFGYDLDDTSFDIVLHYKI